MRRVLLLLTMLALAGCSAPQAPTPTVELLGAPATLNVSGTLVTALAMPTVRIGTFKVQVRLHADRSLGPGLRLTGVYVVTDAGVWKGAVGSAQRSACGSTCLQGKASGSATGLRAGQTVQVVARVQDGQGRALWVRAPKVTVGAAP